MNQKMNIFLNKVCWLCVAKAGIALGIVSIFVARKNIFIPMGAIVFSIVALAFNNRQVDQAKRDMTKVLASIGLTLGVLFLLTGLLGI